MPIQQVIPFTLEVMAVPTPPNFFPSIDPNVAKVVQGTVAVYALSFSAVGGYSNPISLAVLGLPAEATATFGVNPCAVTDVVSLQITTVDVPVALYDLKIEATEVVPASAPKK